MVLRSKIHHLLLHRSSWNCHRCTRYPYLDLTLAFGKEGCSWVVKLLIVMDSKGLMILTAYNEDISAGLSHSVTVWDANLIIRDTVQILSALSKLSAIEIVTVPSKCSSWWFWPMQVGNHIWEQGWRCPIPWGCSWRHQCFFVGCRIELRTCLRWLKAQFWRQIDWVQPHYVTCILDLGLLPYLIVNDLDLT